MGSVLAWHIGKIIMWEKIREIERGCCPKNGFGRWWSSVGMYAVMICNLSYRKLWTIESY